MKRILILDSKCGESIFEAFKANIDYSHLSKEVELKLDYDNHFRHLPENFDLYIIHFSNTSEEALVELREKQP